MPRFSTSTCLVSFSKRSSSIVQGTAAQVLICISSPIIQQTEAFFDRQISAAMTSQSTAPWRCSRCMQLRKHSAMHCVTCNLPWHMVIDNSYVHGPNSPRKIAKEQEAYSGTWQQPWNWDQTGQHHRPKSPRQRNRPCSAKGTRQPAR